MVKEDIINWAKKSMEEIGGKKAIIGISGGKDSTIVAKIFVDALGKENVIGVLMPDGEQKDISDSYNVCRLLDIDYMNVPIHLAKEMLYYPLFMGRSNISGKLKYNDIPYYPSSVTKTNTPPRLRMAMLYALAGSITGGRVINTSNYSEYYTGWCTKWGDMNGDLYPLLNLTKTEVVELGIELGDSFSGKRLEVWNDLVNKIPEDGLTGKSDEENLGVSYKVLDRYLDNVRDIGSRLLPHITDEVWVNSMYGVTLEQARLIEDKHNKARHKIEKGPVFTPKTGGFGVKV